MSDACPGQILYTEVQTLPLKNSVSTPKEDFRSKSQVWIHPNRPAMCPVIMFYENFN